MCAVRFTNADSDRNTNCDRSSHANYNNYSNTNSYRYSFTYTNSNCQAVAVAENSAHTKAAPNATAKTIGFGGLWLFEICFVLVRRRA